MAVHSGFPHSSETISFPRPPYFPFPPQLGGIFAQIEKVNFFLHLPIFQE
jgi:hypothetical protein